MSYWLGDTGWWIDSTSCHKSDPRGTPFSDGKRASRHTLPAIDGVRTAKSNLALPRHAILLLRSAYLTTPSSISLRFL